ncbi:MAG: histidine kinase [Emticicia sp.]|nr:histidine kinase [Emticicia sp.]
MPHNIFRRNLQGFLSSFALCILLVYGLSGITYFTSELLYVNESGFSFTSIIVISNIIDALLALLVCQIFFNFHHIFPTDWLKYGIISIATFTLTYFSSKFIWRYLFDEEAVEYVLENSSSSTTLFSISPVVVACLYFYFWQKSSQIDLKISEQEFKILQIEKLKTKAELDALQARINPHFLYNSLNSIASLVYLDPSKAEKMTLLLAKLFRYTTGEKANHFNSITNELEIVTTYLSIEQVRFGERLSYEIEVENGLQMIEIPRFLIQPIVENAIKHGISKTPKHGKIAIKVIVFSDYCQIMVHDNGPSFPNNFITGYGLQSIQDKLQLIYGTNAFLHIDNADYKQVIVKIPLNK